jgi:hypothetical protein
VQKIIMAYDRHHESNSQQLPLRLQEPFARRGD